MSTFDYVKRHHVFLNNSLSACPAYYTFCYLLMTIDTKDSPRRSNDSYMEPRSYFLKTPVTSSHWQLKNMLVKSSLDSGGDNTNLYYTQKNNIQKVNLPSLESNRYVYDDELTFSTSEFSADITPATIDECDGVMAIGGHCLSSPMRAGVRSLGYFAMYFPESDKLERCDIGQMINNSVTVDKVPGSSNQYKSYICNNDRKLYSADARSSNIIINQPIQFQSSLNNCKMSPDFKTVVTVGDCSDIFIVHPEQPFKTAEKIKTNSDSGFSTAFSKGGVQFTTCFQSGEAYIYDVRNLTKPLHTVHTTRKLTQGSFRNVRTADPLEDVVFISEHEGRIHIIDTRDFNKHMVILLPTTLINLKSSNGITYNQPVIKPYRVIKDEIKNFGGEIEKSIHSYRGSLYPYINSSNSGGLFNRNSITSLLSSPGSGFAQRYRRFQENSTFRTSTGGSNGNSDANSFESVEHPHTVTASPSINIVQFSESEEEGEDFDRPVSAGDDMISNVETPPTSAMNITGTDDNFTWTRQETGKEYKNQQVKDSRLFQYKSDDCPVIYSTEKSDIEYVLDLEKRKYTVRNGWDLINPKNDPFHFVDSTLDILGMDVLDYKGEKILAFASPEGINLWSINQWKRQCYPIYELC